MVGGTYARAQEAGYKGKQLSFIVDLARDTREEAVQEVKRYLLSQEDEKTSLRQKRAENRQIVIWIVLVVACIFCLGFFVGTHFPIN